MLRRLNILVGHEMIRHQSYLVLVKYALGRELVHLLDCHGAGDVIAQYQVQIRLDQLARIHLFKPCRSRQNLLRHCHSHIHNHSFPSKISILDDNTIMDIVQTFFIVRKNCIKLHKKAPRSLSAIRALLFLYQTVLLSLSALYIPVDISCICLG